jgi:hypothetical protein
MHSESTESEPNKQKLTEFICSFYSFLDRIAVPLYSPSMSLDYRLASKNTYSKQEVDTLSSNLLNLEL